MKSSVALCTFNGEKFIAEQLDSILAQVQKVNEIIICDDGSTDDTISIITSYQEKFPELIQLHKNQQQLGSVKNFEKAISLCSHELIFLCDQDDAWLPDKTKLITKYFKDNPQISVICTNGFVINEKGHLKAEKTLWDIPESLAAKGVKFQLESNFLIGNLATGASMALRKDFIPLCIPFPQSPDLHHDFWLALVSIYYEKFNILSDKTIKYRSHENQQVGSIIPRKPSEETDLYQLEDSHSSFTTLRRQIRRATLARKKLQNLDIISTETKEVLEYFNYLATVFIDKRHSLMRRKFRISYYFWKLYYDLKYK